MSQLGRFSEAVGVLAEEVAAARTLKRGCCASAAVLQCLVRPESERKQAQCRETCRNELFDLFGIWIGSYFHVYEDLQAEIKRNNRQRPRLQAEGNDAIGQTFFLLGSLNYLAEGLLHLRCYAFGRDGRGHTNSIAVHPTCHQSTEYQRNTPRADGIL